MLVDCHWAAATGQCAESGLGSAQHVCACDSLGPVCIRSRLRSCSCVRRRDAELDSLLQRLVRFRHIVKDGARSGTYSPGHADDLVELPPTMRRCSPDGNSQDDDAWYEWGYAVHCLPDVMVLKSRSSCRPQLRPPRPSPQSRPCRPRPCAASLPQSGQHAVPPSSHRPQHV